MSTPKQQTNLKVLLEEINEENIGKGSLKCYQVEVKQYKKNRTFQNIERKFNKQSMENAWRQKNSRTQRRRSIFRGKFGSRKNIT